MSTKLRDLIKNVRGAKTAAEERAIVAKECAAIRSTFSGTDNASRSRSISKLLVCFLFQNAHARNTDIQKKIIQFSLF